MEYAEARKAARLTATDGDYLAYYADTPGDDHGSRCGFSDDQLDELDELLSVRGLRLVADDRGLVVQTISSVE